LGDDSKMHVMGKGNLKLFIGGITQVITDVYYLPRLKNNLLKHSTASTKKIDYNFSKGFLQDIS
jgi:hypothetical protein